MERNFVINFGYDSIGRPKNRYFATVEAATKAASAFFNKTGNVVGIEAVK